MSSAILAPEPAPGLSEPQRLLNVFLAPSKTFRDLNRVGRWWSPYLLLVIMGALVTFSILSKVGLEQLMANEIAKNPKAAERIEKMSPEQRESMMAGQMKFARVMTYAFPANMLIYLLVAAGVLLAVFNFAFGASLKFGTSLAVVSYASLTGLVSSVLLVLSLWGGVDPEAFSASNPIASNPAYFMDAAAAPLLYRVAAMLDVFVWWTIVLMGIGYSSVSKIKAGTAIAAVAATYIAYKAIGIGLAAVIG